MRQELILTEVHRVVELQVMPGCWRAAEWEARRQGVPEQVQPKITYRSRRQVGVPDVWRWEWLELAEEHAQS